MRFLAKLAILGLAAVAALAPISPDWVERAYSRALYPALQNALTPLSNRATIALLDPAALAVAACLAAWWIGSLVRSRGRRLRAVARLVVNTCVLGAMLYLAFLVLWGFNYRRQPLMSRLDFDAGRVSEAMVVDLVRASVGQMNVLAPAARRAPIGFDQAPARLHAAFRHVLDLLGQPPVVPGHPKRSFLNLYFQRAAVDGMTDPFFLEVLLRDDLLPFERPYAVAHEWAHLAGFADESEASFVGWLTCQHADEAARYSASMFMYLQAGGDLDDARRDSLSAALTSIPREDLAELYKQYQRQVWPSARDAGRAVYDRFLRANRVQEGIRSYDGVVRLVLGTRFAAPHVPVLQPAAPRS